MTRIIRKDAPQGVLLFFPETLSGSVFVGLFFTKTVNPGILYEIFGGKLCGLWG